MLTRRRGGIVRVTRSVFGVFVPISQLQVAIILRNVPDWDIALFFATFLFARFRQGQRGVQLVGVLHQRIAPVGALSLRRTWPHPPYAC